MKNMVQHRLCNLSHLFNKDDCLAIRYSTASLVLTINIHHAGAVALRGFFMSELKIINYLSTFLQFFLINSGTKWSKVVYSGVEAGEVGQIFGKGTEHGL